MFFILSTSLFVFILTYFSSVQVLICVLLVCCGGVCLWQKSLKKRGFYILILLLSAVAVGTCIYRRNMSYVDKQDNLSSRFIGTGTILEVYGNDRYVLEDQEKRKYLYYSKRSYLAGVTISSVASLEVGTGGVDIFSPIALDSLRQRFFSLGNDERGFDKSKRLLMKNWIGVMYENDGRIIDQNRHNLLDKMRSKLAFHLGNIFSKRTSSLTMGMLVGDRSGMSKEEYASFIDSGLVHIIAVSGGNIVLIVSFLSMVFFFLPYYVRIFVVLLSVVCYALLCGLDSSVMRATLMATLGIIAIFAGRQLPVRRSMGYVYVVMLFRNPYFLVYDLGFIFSFSALSGLVFFADRWSTSIQKKITINTILPRFRNTYMLPSVAAGLGIFVPLLFFTGRVNLLSILSNVLVIPLIPFVMIYGFLSSLLYSITSRRWLGLPQEKIVDRIYLVNDMSNTYSIVLYTNEGYTRIILLFVLSLIIVIYIIYKRRM